MAKQIAPLDDLVVIEVANWLAAPSTAALLADLGARVIKVEQPGGDGYRYVGLRPRIEGPRAEANFPFILDNRGKQSITIALDRPGGTETLLRIVEAGDVYLTNMTPARAARYGLTPEAVLGRNPGAVYATLTGYGLAGPEANRGGYDNAAFFGRSGITQLTGEPDAPMPRFRDGIGDHTAALNLLSAILTALRVRDRTGEGQIVDVSLYGTGIWTIGADHSTALIDGRQPPKNDRDHPKNPLANAYRCAGGRWLVLTMARADAYWPGFCRALARPELFDDPRYATLALRREHSPELTRLLDEIFATRDRDQWGERLDAEGVVWAPVFTLPEVHRDPQAQALGIFQSIDDPRIGRFETVGVPFTVRGADIRVRGPAPDAGEHTYDILTEFGFAPDEIADLAAVGVFG